MNDKQYFWLKAIWYFTIGFWGSALYNQIDTDKKFENIDIKVTELKQKLKESQQHANIKFEACMKQLIGKKP